MICVSVAALLKDRYPRIRDAAVEAVSRMTTKENVQVVVSTLTDLLEHWDENVPIAPPRVDSSKGQKIGHF